MLYLILFLIAYILGILLGLDFKNLVPIFLYLFCIALIFLLVIKLKKLYSKYFYVSKVSKSATIKLELSKNVCFSKFKTAHFLIILLGIVIGCANSYYRNLNFTQKYSSGELYGSGTVQKLISNGSYYNKFFFENELGDKFLIYIPNTFDISSYTQINYKATLKKPSKARNEGGYDYYNYLCSQNIYGSLYIESSNDIEVIGNTSNFIYEIQNSILNVFGKLFPKDELRNFASV